MASVAYYSVIGRDESILLLRPNGDERKKLCRENFTRQLSSYLAIYLFFGYAAFPVRGYGAFAKGGVFMSSDRDDFRVLLPLILK